MDGKILTVRPMGDKGVVTYYTREQVALWLAMEEWYDSVPMFMFLLNSWCRVGPPRLDVDDVDIPFVYLFI